MTTRVVSAALLTTAIIAMEPGENASASEGPPPVLHIATYRSPTGVCALTVDPSDLHGQGKGAYSLERDGTHRWTRDLKFTFWEAAVTDDGVAAGYAYTHGWRGFHRDGLDRGYGDFIVAVLNRDGTPRNVVTIPRVGGGMHEPPGPVAIGCFLDPEGDRFVVRFRANDNLGDPSERWSVFRLSDGQPQPDVTLPPPADPDPAGARYMAIDARPVYGTDLTLVLWSRAVWGAEHHEGSRLSLVDRQCAERWSRTWEDDFRDVERFIPWMMGEANLATTDGKAPGRFVYRSFGEQNRSTFAVQRDEAVPGGWKVTEQTKEPDTVRFRGWDDGSSTLPEVVLDARGVITLNAGNAEAPMLGIGDFAFDGAGRIGFVSTEVKEQFELTVLDAGGGPVAVVPLGFGVEKGRPVPRVAWIGGDRWIVLWSNHGDQADVRAFIVDTRARTATPVEGFSSPKLSMQHALAGGAAGFAVIGDYSSPDMVVFGPDAKPRWTGQKPGAICQAVAMRDSGEVAVLVGITNRIEVYSAAGEHTRSIELVKAIGGALNYVAGLAPDIDGGWVLHDFNGSPPVYRLGADGAVKARFEPRYADGRTFTLYGGAKAAPDGRLWTSDRAALLRMADDGVVDLVLGPKPESDSIGEVRALAVDRTGLIYAVDGRSGSVHIFNTEGVRQRLLKPEPTDFPVTSDIGSITVAGDGSVYYRTSSMGRGFGGASYMKFGPDGARAGFQDRVGGEVREDWVFRPGGQDRLVLGYERAWLVSPDGTKSRTIERRADRKWLDKVQRGAVAADGSFAIVAMPGNGLFSAVPPSVTVYSSNGEPERTIELPRMSGFARVALTGKYACVVSDPDMLLLDRATGVVSHCSIPGAGEKTWSTPFMSPDGREVWLQDAHSPELRRFALPPA